MKETTATDGPEGTVSSKTQESLVLLERGTEQLRDNVKNVNVDYLGDIDLRTLLTTQVENRSCSLPLQKRDFHCSSVCSSVWKSY